MIGSEISLIGLKALILAGGFGTRLRPLSCSRPKLMFPIANRPILEWTLEGLKKCGVDEVILAVNYMADVLEKHFGNSRRGLKISYSKEVKPLGTGGPIKEAEEQLVEEGDKEPFLVLNGDIISSIDYTALYQAHVNSGAEITISLHQVEDPSRYGVVEITDNERILRFIEKPPPGSEPSNLINAGVYVINPSVLNKIPKGKKISIEREVFPRLATSGLLYGYQFEGFWFDIGVPDDYLNANMRLLEKISRESTSIEKSAKVNSRSKIIQPVALSEEVIIEENAVIGPYVSLGKDSYIERGSKLENSILFNEVYVDEFSIIQGAIIGERSVLGKCVKIKSGCILGDNVQVRDNVTLTEGVQVCPHKEIIESVFEKRFIT